MVQKCFFTLQGLPVYHTWFLKLSQHGDPIGRDMTQAGLSYEAAMADPSLMRLEVSAQLRNQLKKFASGEAKSAGTVQREIFNASRGGAGSGRPSRSSQPAQLMDLDLSSGTDDSVGAIAKRVGLLVVLSVVGFVALFKVGLQFLQ